MKFHSYLWPPRITKKKYKTWYLLTSLHGGGGQVRLVCGDFKEAINNCAL